MTKKAVARLVERDCIWAQAPFKREIGTDEGP